MCTGPAGRTIPLVRFQEVDGALHAINPLTGISVEQGW
jgi:hypothetical protein